MAARSDRGCCTDLVGWFCPSDSGQGDALRGNTPWHTDFDLPVASIGIVAYFESLGEDGGALRVLPGSYRPEFANAIRALGTVGKPAESLPAYVIGTEPGDSMSTSSTRMTAGGLADTPN